MSISASVPRNKASSLLPCATSLTRSFPVCLAHSLPLFTLIPRKMHYKSINKRLLFMVLVLLVGRVSMSQKLEWLPEVRSRSSLLFVPELRHGFILSFFFTCTVRGADFIGVSMYSWDKSDLGLQSSPNTDSLNDKYSPSDRLQKICGHLSRWVSMLWLQIPKLTFP